MDRSTPFSTATLPVPNLIRRLPLRRSFVLIALALGSFALPRTVQGADGGLPNNNTAEGDFALSNVTSGFDNTALGYFALHFNTTGNDNTATGLSALDFNTTGSANTANGAAALLFNTTGSNNTATGGGALENNTIGSENTANGSGALFNNTTGNFNTADGDFALQGNTTGGDNTANGFEALASNTTGDQNTASGSGALFNNTTGSVNTANGAGTLNANTTGRGNTATGAFALEVNSTGSNNTATGAAALNGNTTGNSNTASGANALESNTTGFDNTASGAQALRFNTGSSNIALGTNAGINLTTGSNNIDIGNLGSAGESNTIRIGTKGTQKNTHIAGIYGAVVAGGVGVIVDSHGQLGTILSSARYKEAIKPMDKASEAILQLEPVSFRYKEEIDPNGIPQFGLVAEQVEKVNPDLVVRDDQGKVNTVRYEAVNAMLLNEFLKEHRTVQDLKKELAALTATVKEQAALIRKVSHRFEVSNAAPQLVADNP
jgi:hypothetical protein